MSRPQLEVADIIRSAGTDFVERNRHWLRWIHLKVLRAIARCRTAALAGHIDECTCCGHRAPISYNRCRNRHCPKCQTGARERWIVVNCCPRPTSMSSSPCRRNWLRWLSRTGNSSTVCCFAPAQKLYSKWLVIPPISEPRSASSACCTPGTRNSNCLCRSRRWTLPRSRPLDSIPPALLPSHRHTAARVPWQVHLCSEVRL
jgi:hypothetical protein